MDKKDKTIRILGEVKEILIQLVFWGGLVNLFFLIPFAFFGCMPVTVCFVWSCIILCIAISNCIINEVRTRLIKSIASKDFEKFKEDLKKLAEKFKKDLESNDEVEVEEPNYKEEEKKND